MLHCEGFFFHRGRKLLLKTLRTKLSRKGHRTTERTTEELKTDMTNLIENTPRGIYALLQDLMRVRSISGTEGENELVRFLRDRLAALPYFRVHPENLFLAPVETGGLGRHALLAFVEASPRTAKTVVLTGHYDVVDVDVCGELRDLAFEPEVYSRRIGERDISPEARRDLVSGNFLFGRGIMDMKGGLAIHAAYLAEMAAAPERLKTNLLFLAVPDEEVDSVGMRGAVPHLVRFAEERGLDYRAALLGEPFKRGVAEGGEAARVSYLGSTGKVTALFFCVGCPTHVGRYFDGVNSLLLATHVMAEMEGNPNLLDGDASGPLCPPACLRMKDLREHYSVTLPERSAAYFSVLFVTRTLGEILEEMRRVAAQALDRTAARLASVRRSYCERLGQADPGTDPLGGASERRVYEVREVFRLAAALLGGEAALSRRVESIASRLPDTMDQREKGIRLLDEVLSLSGLKGPCIVVGFLPPFYPSRVNAGRTDQERRLRTAVADLGDYAWEAHGERLQVLDYCGGITDMSYLGFQGTEEELCLLEENLPGWGTLYALSVKDLLRLDVPGFILGCGGEDAHKDTERMDVPFSLETAPKLLRYLVERLAAEE